MSAETVTTWLTGPRAKKLLRLYLAWPFRFDAAPDKEARLFYSWLKQHYGDLSVVESIKGHYEVAEFLNLNPEVIEAAKFLKANEGTVGDEVRKDKRISADAHVFLGIYDCGSDPSLIGHTMKGSAVDVTPNGLCVELEESVPNDAILSLTVAPVGFPIVLYRITGEVRWTQKSKTGYQLGISMFDVGEAKRWRQDFDTRFQADCRNAG